MTYSNPAVVTQSGVYTATCTTSCGTSVASNSIQITTGGIPNAPTITANKTSLCAGESATLTAANCSGTVKWLLNGNLLTSANPTLVNQSGVYTATCTTNCGTSVASNSVTITTGGIPNAPTITADKTSLCAGESATLTAANCSGTLSWRKDGQSETYSNPAVVTQSGVYTATCTTSCGTSVASNSIQISTGGIPNAPTITADKTSLCAGESATLTAANCSGTINWLLNGVPSSNTNPLVVTQSGVYTATCTTSCGTSVASNSIQINTGGIPDAPVITADKTSLCAGESATLTAANCNGTINWLLNGAPNSNTNPLVVTQSGVYTATCTTSCGTSVASNSIQINTGGIPDAPVITADKTSLCAGESATLTAANCSGTLSWRKDGQSVTYSNPAVVAQSGVYTATCTTSCGTSVASNSIQISTGGIPNAPTITADKTSLCAGESATLTAANCGGTINWLLNGAPSSNTNPLVVTQSGVYTATCTTSCGTSVASNSIQINTGGLPDAPVITADKTNLCAGESATLTAANCSGTINWLLNGAPSSNTNPLVVTQSGIYTATCTTSCGTSVASNSIQINTGGLPDAPVITADKTNLCAGESATLTAANCSGTINWLLNGAPSSNTNPLVVTQSGVYTATCTTSCGTSVASNSIQINTGGIPNAPTITADKTSLCAGESATLTAANCSGTINWLLNGAPNSNTNPLVVTQSGVYTATCTTSCGTSVASNSIQINTGGLPDAPVITADKTNLCAGESATLTAANCSGTINWLLNGAPSSNTNPLVVTQSGIYTATCTTSCGTSVASNSIQINTGGLPDAPVITADKTNLCAGESATLTADNCSGTINWLLNGVPNSNTNPLVVTQSGVYTATCTTSCGTSVASNSIQINTGGLPDAPVITADKTNLCAGESATLTAANCSGTINWLLNGAPNSNTNPLVVTQSGVYTATCTTSCGTSVSSNSIQINTGGIPNAPTITADKTSLCAGESATLTAANCSGTINWLLNGAPDSNTNPLVVTQSGVYTATCTTSCGTSVASNNIQINTGGLPDAPVITADKTSLCAGESATLTAANCSGTINWLLNGAPDSNTNPLVVTQSGVYTATCTTSCGTSVASNSIQISTGGIPNAPTITADKTSLCAGESATLTAANCSGTINWLLNGAPNSNTNPLVVTQSGVYTATCTTSCGTSVASNSIQINTGGIPNAPTITADKTSLCAGESATLTAANCSGTINWLLNGAPDSNTNPLVVTQSGIYTATCTTNCGTSVVSNEIVIISKTDCSICNVVNPVISANKTSICKPENVTLTAIGCGEGLVIWSSGQIGSSITVKPTATSIYTAVCKESNVCSSGLSNAVQIKMANVTLPSLVCLTDFVCTGESVTIKASGCEGVVVWSTGEIGETLTLVPDSTVKYTAKCKVGECESGVTEPVMIPYGSPNKPFIHCKKQICPGESTVMTATGCTGLVVWSTGATGAVLTVTPTQEFTTYWAKCQSLSGKCESPRSNEVTVTVGKAAIAPTVIAEIRNVCPFNTADLNTAILTDISTVGGQFEFHTANSSSSPIIANPAAVGAGTYYVFERTSAGCYSAGSVIKVVITTCDGGVTPSTPIVDLAVKKTASANKVAIDQEVEYKVSVKNVGTQKATGIEVRDILPYKLSFISASANATYINGIVKLKLDSLSAGDSVAFTYKTRVVAGGKIINKAELSKVNEVDNITENNVSEYTINDPGQETSLLGMSKISGEPLLVSGKTYTIPFTIYVKNMGNEDVTSVQVVDDLEKAFGSGAKILNDTVKVTADFGLVVNPSYTGRGANKNMLIDSLSSIKKGTTSKLTFKVKVDFSEATADMYYNKAELYVNGQKKEESTDGVDPDPDNDGDPTNNNDPTPIEVQIDMNPTEPAIGISLAITDSTKLDETTYSVTYLALVKNVGRTRLANVQVSDSLSKTFADSTSYVMVGKPAVGLNSTLKVNPNFDGKEDVNLLIADTTSQLAVGKLDSIFYTVKVFHNGHKGPYESYAYAKAIGNNQFVSDKSNAGMEVKPNLTSPTILTLPLNTSGVLFIPEAFSPNGDGKNDVLIAKAPDGVKIEYSEIYNRWGFLIFKDDKNMLFTEGWNGVANVGILVNPKNNSVPDGTYYYSIKIAGESKPRVGFITLKR
ncbi:gliding motility-associated C-terminal domain-containing protein [Emticicia sp. 17c]|uniref:T9SS type B sorting domain-containing protein n=1 Tax=Emticicia sp. 17c TaxID=3127704 RepID=UPI00301DC1C6